MQRQCRLFARPVNRVSMRRIEFGAKRQTFCPQTLNKYAFAALRLQIGKLVCQAYPVKSAVWWPSTGIGIRKPGDCPAIGRPSDARGEALATTIAQPQRLSPSRSRRLRPRCF